MSEWQYLVAGRHAQSEANAGLTTSADGLHYSDSLTDVDVALTAAGVLQGTDLGKRLVRLFPRSRKFSVVYHTDFRRVLQMLHLVRRQLKYKVRAVSDARLNKRNYGIFWNLTRLGVEALHPAEWLKYRAEGDLNYRPPGGENYHDVFARVDDFIDTRLANSKGHILVLAHLVVLLAFQRRFERLSDAELLHRYETVALPNAEILIYRRKSAAHPWERYDGGDLRIHALSA